MAQPAKQSTRQLPTHEDDSTTLTGDRKVSPLRRRFIQDLELAGLSPNSVKAYVRSVRRMSEHFGLAPDTLSEQQVRDYLSHLQHEKHYAAGTLKIAYSGLNWFFKHTYPRDWHTLPRLKPPKQVPLPDVLTPQEARQLIGSVRTEHNRVCLWTIYSCGLRLAEGCHK